MIIKMIEPLVSIIIPTYNRVDLLKRSLESVLDQTYKNLEIIVSDDFSTKSNPKLIVKSYNDKRIRYIRTDKNVGTYKNFKFALSYVSGKYLMMLGDDDILGDIEFIKSAVKKYNSDIQIDAVFGKLKVLNKYGDYIKEYNFKSEYSSKEFLLDWFSIVSNIASYSNFLLKTNIFKKAVEKVTIYGTTADYFILLQMILTSNKISFINKISYCWTTGNESFSNSNFNDLTIQLNNIMTFPNEGYNLLKDKEEFEFFRELFNKYIMYSVNALISNYHIYHNEFYFNNLFNKYQLLSKEIYIYGKGEVGLALNNFLLLKNIYINGFIDDFRIAKDILTLDEFKNIQNDNILVIISSYKSNYIFNIYKSLISIKNSKFNIIELLDDNIDEELRNTI